MLGRGKNRGFTLIEIMIVVAIIGILSAIAYPSYINYVRRAHMQSAFSAMSEVRFGLERFFQNNNTYGTTASTCPITMPTVEEFTFTCTWRSDGPDADTSSSYLVTATGTGVMAGHTFTLNEQNLPQTTAFTNGSGLPQSCWMTHSSGCQ